jgi:hypothetical protein
VYGSKVQFDEIDKVTTYVNQNQISAEIPAYDLEKEEEYQVTVISPMHRGKGLYAGKFTVTETGGFWNSCLLKYF